MFNLLLARKNTFFNWFYVIWNIYFSSSYYFYFADSPTVLTAHCLNCVYQVFSFPPFFFSAIFDNWKKRVHQFIWGPPGERMDFTTWSRLFLLGNRDGQHPCFFVWLFHTTDVQPSFHPLQLFNQADGWICCFWKGFPAAMASSVKLFVRRKKQCFSTFGGPGKQC